MTPTTICTDCARKHHAKWPRGLQAAWWSGNCDLCGEEKAVCSVSDWKWPVGRPVAEKVAE